MAVNYMDTQPGTVQQVVWTMGINSVTLGNAFLSTFNIEF